MAIKFRFQNFAVSACELVLISPAIALAVLLGPTAGWAQASPTRDGLIDGHSLQPIAIDDVVSKVEPGGVLIVSEYHGFATHYDRQKEALHALSKTGRCTVSVGLEFLAWPYQTSISEYFAGTRSEAAMLKDVEWGTAIPFEGYRDQALFPRTTGGLLLGLNATRALSGAVRQRGVEGLTPDEAAQMPPNFELGDQEYRQRFELVLPHSMSTAAMDRYFAAQSVWDDSMAWQAVEFLKTHPSHCLVIIVGDFHAQFGGGLPDRLRARGLKNVTVISQFDTAGLSEQEVRNEQGPHPQYGPRADAIWLSETP